MANHRRSLVINEMVSPKWQNLPAPGGPPGMSLGDAALDTFDFYTSKSLHLHTVSLRAFYQSNCAHL